jgi:acylphosphatase
MRSPSRRAVDITVTGRVQGVSFRAYAELEAARLGVTGWVRNEPDGDVTAHVEGDADAVDAFVRWCYDGPRLARVSSVDVAPAVETGATSFDVRS